MSPLADFILKRLQYRLPQPLLSYAQGVSPMSTDATVGAALVTYLVVIFGIQAAMKNRQAKELTNLLQIHNVFLTWASLVLLILILEEIFPILWSRGLFNALCAEESWTSRLEFYYMVNYYFKYFELLDTVFLVLKKRPLQFLHVFHHPATALLAYIHLNGRPSSSWIIVSLNLAVHVVMYYYYYMTADGARLWWKKYLTTLQIGQFVVDLSVTYFATYQHIAATYYVRLPHLGDCATSDFSAVFGNTLLTFYLGLFINFYLKTYKTPTKSTSNGIVTVGTNRRLNGHKRKL